MASKNASIYSTPSGKGGLTLAERKAFKLGKLLGVVEDVFNEPELIGRGVSTRPLQTTSYDFSTGHNWRVGWLRHTTEWRMYAQAQKLDGSSVPDKVGAIFQAAQSVRHLVKKMQLFPKNVQDTAMYAFRAATVFMQWQDKDGVSTHAAWLHPTKFTNIDWYYLGSGVGLEIKLLEEMRKGVIDLRDARYMLL